MAWKPFNQQAYSRGIQLESYGRPELTKRLAIFCSGGGGIGYAWEQGDITNRGGNEYSIVELESGVERVCRSSPEFIRQCCERQF